MAFTGVCTAAITDDVGVTTANEYLLLSCRIAHSDRQACGHTTTSEQVYIIIYIKLCLHIIHIFYDVG